MKVLIRIVCVALALMFVVPHVSGVHIHGTAVEALEASLVFNLSLWALECALAVLVLSINIGTLGLGAFLAAGLKFVATLLSPSLALLGTSLFLPNYLQVNHFFPGGLAAGLMLGGVLWVSMPTPKKAKQDD